MKSFAREPAPRDVAALHALVQSGAVAPMKPLASAWELRAPIARAAEALVACVDVLLKRWVERAPGPTLRLYPRLEPLARFDGEAGRRLFSTRLDVVCPPEAPEHFQLLEVQAGDPSAMGWVEQLLGALKLPRWNLADSHRRAVERHTSARRIAFVVVNESIVESDHRALAAHYRAHGWSAVVCDPRKLNFDGETLRADGQPVEVVFRDAIDELFDAPWTSGGEALVAAQRAGRVLVLNPFTATVADDKAWLETLSTRDGWSEEQWELLSRHVPWTRRLTEAHAAHARANRSSLVLKPVDGYGGYGVVIGAETSEPGWNAAVDAALTGPKPCVVQRYVPLPRQGVWRLTSDGRAELASLRVVHSFFCHDGAFAGGFVRAAEGAVVNVHQGGGLGPLYLADGFGY